MALNLNFSLTINSGDDAATDIAAALNTELQEDLPGIGSPYSNTSSMVKVITGVLEEQAGSTSPTGAFTIVLRSSPTVFSVTVNGP